MSLILLYMQWCSPSLCVKLTLTWTMCILVLNHIDSRFILFLLLVIVLSLYMWVTWTCLLNDPTKPHCTEHWMTACECLSLSATALPLSRWPTSAKLKLALKLRPTKWSICLQCHSKGRLISMNTSSGLWSSTLGGEEGEEETVLGHVIILKTFTGRCPSQSTILVLNESKLCWKVSFKWNDFVFSVLEGVIHFYHFLLLNIHICNPLYS